MDITLGQKINLVQPNDMTFEDFKSYLRYSYISLLKGSVINRPINKGKDTSKFDDYMNKIVEWLDSTDFFYAPASTRFHDSCECGLVYHTLNVYNNMIDLITIPKFKSVDLYSATFVCLVHDFCKINLYESYLKNVKDENGNWNQVKAYKHNDNVMMPMGHGIQSMYMVSKMLKLTDEEALAIRWHMSSWYVGDWESNEFQQANENYPLVLLLQFSDQLSIVNY